MAKEIERKFLVISDEYKALGEGVLYRQGYLSRVKERIVRVRLVGERGFLTIKGENRGAVRDEFEYEIPAEDATLMLDLLCEKPLIEKKRYRITHAGIIWEVDEFLGENEGLVLAEVELDNENQVIELPNWIGKEVTADARYFNSNLSLLPFKRWQSEDKRC